VATGGVSRQSRQRRSLRAGRHRPPPVVVATSEREAVSHDNGIEVVLVPSILSCATCTSLPTQRCPQADAAHLPIGDIAPIEKGAIAAYREESGRPSGGGLIWGEEGRRVAAGAGRVTLAYPCGVRAGGGRREMSYANGDRSSPVVRLRVILGRLLARGRRSGMTLGSRSTTDRDGGQKVDHLHARVLRGRKMRRAFA
jgi:hypothetical protein